MMMKYHDAIDDDEIHMIHYIQGLGSSIPMNTPDEYCDHQSACGDYAITSNFEEGQDQKSTSKFC